MGGSAGFDGQFNLGLKHSLLASLDLTQTKIQVNFQGTTSVDVVLAVQSKLFGKRVQWKQMIG